MCATLVSCSFLDCEQEKKDKFVETANVGEQDEMGMK